MTSSKAPSSSLLERARFSATYRSRRLIRRLREGKEAPRAREDYATHVPVLAGIGALRRVERVLELGAGSFSTLVFLDHEIFPSLTRLDSIETDADWAAIVIERVAGDTRLALRMIDQPVAGLVPTLDLDKYDLILIDDSTALHQRSATVKAVATAVPVGPLVVIHDFEVDAYRQASATMDHRILFRRFTPQTAVAWQGGSAPRKQLRALSERIEQAPSALSPADGAAWARILAASDA